MRQIQDIYKAQGKKSLVFYDIGCNKGYTSANFLTAFAPSYGMTPPSVNQAITKYAGEHGQQIEKACGVCGDCLESPPSLYKAGEEPHTVHVHCFEPSPRTFEILKFVDGQHQGSSQHRWRRHNLGVYSSSMKLFFDKSCASGKDSGGEKCGIVSEGEAGAITVQAVTVDDFVKRGDGSATADDLGRAPDILKIDAEGYDPAVLKGAATTLRSGQTPVVLFEYNRGLTAGLWLTESLESVVTTLDEYGYDCYFSSNRIKADHATTPSLYRLTGGCLSYPIPHRGWANVVCAHRQHEQVARMLLGLATLLG